MRFGRRVTARSHNDLRATKHTTQHRTREWEATRHRYFGTMNHHAIGPLKPWSKNAQRHSWIEQNKIDIEFTRKCIDSTSEGSCRQQHFCAVSFDADRLLRIECFRSGMGRGEYRG
jgi:hypothetical protein